MERIINKSTTARDLDRIGSLGIDKVEIQLEVRKSKQYQPIELIALIQFLITNLKSNKNFVIKTDLTTNEITDVTKRFVDYYHLLCVILYSENIQIKTKSGSIILIDDINRILVKKLIAQEEMYARDFDSEIQQEIESTDKDIAELRRYLFSSKTKDKYDGVSFMIPCFDHLEKLKRSYYFYGKQSSKDNEDIKLWLARVFQFNHLEISMPNLLEDLSIMIKELVQNTHDWARDTFDKSHEIKPNLRACLINIFLEDRLEKEVYSYDPIREYLKNIYSVDRNDFLIADKQGRIFGDQNLGICEISVLDSGPGMGRRWLEKDYADISHENELDAVKNCFYKHLTSDTSGKRQLRGRGLARVLSLIGKRGLLRVRTGGVLLLRDFYTNNLNQTEFDEIKLDFQSSSGLNRFEGTSISILYPFVYTKV